MQAASNAAFRIAPGIAIGALLRQAPILQMEARILLAHCLQLSRVQLVTQSERQLSTDEADRLSVLFHRRLAGEPIAYLLGEREFFGLMLTVTPDVLIPRPETELLVELALERLPEHGRVLDMGTGSGAIVLAIAHTRPDACPSALDASTAALTVARGNAARHGVAVRFLHSDWFSALAGDQFELIVANPPYIADGDAHLAQGDLRFEPADALTDHADGLSALRTIVAGAARHLVAGCWLLLEHGYDQAQAVRALLAQHGYAEVQSWNDLAGIARITGGRRP